ncbi:alpha/beta hydrolase fold domain-containing protein [Variovorax paradoxus]|uniref:Alpha/beta hydrolase fold domain-containing protein n=1 Tax=Variovorax paradoxus TaxID=34073 RepID=A0A5Q0M5R6_VARPD|nr:alpha/beta hydrolase [Variovorax paradoxus]QFZ85100.1 alpha/beta hydrolase fold domain-containing protein [Variovorax paradoxus]
MSIGQSEAVVSIVRQLRALGAKFDPEVLAATRHIYRPLLVLAPAALERHDVAYGDHPRHKLDVYHPAGDCRAIVVNVHGGGFVAGDKNADDVFNCNIGRWLAAHGYAAVLPNYRLAPGHGWPAGAEDVQSVLRWVQSHRADLAPSPRPIVLWGQSAGACHVASWLFDPVAADGRMSDVAAVMLLSGFYSATSPLASGPRAYFGDDASRYSQRSPITHVRHVDVPIWLGVAELDPAPIAEQTYALAGAMTAALARSPDFHFFRGHNHASTVQSLGSPHEDAGSEILRFLGTL